jgi:hypothetical protein
MQKTLRFMNDNVILIHFEITVTMSNTFEDKNYCLLEFVISVVHNYIAMHTVYKNGLL